MKQALILFLMLGLMCCSEDHNGIAPSPTLEGVWVEAEYKTDTLTFTSWGDSEMMMLGRGFETYNGFLQPKPGSGPYRYRISPGTISLYWTGSSNSAYHDYAFNLSENTLRLENFYDAEVDSTLTFERLE